MTRLTATSAPGGGGESSGRSALARAVVRLLCGLRGHDAVLHFEGPRVMMCCTSCGHDSPGWDTRGRAPQLRFAGDPRRHALAPARLARRRA